MIRSKIFRTFALASSFALFNASVPYGALAAVGLPIKEKVKSMLAARARAEKEKAVSRLLTVKEQRAMQGKTGTCPYLAGQNKWDLTHDGIDLMSGNYSTSVTDMSFDGGYGIPVNVTRSYSSNDGSEEPFGYGWSMSADVRNTAGGILKSKSAPIRSVPNNFKERSTAEVDPNVATQPVAAVTSTDASGREETIQKDVDGVLTTPPWDNNVSNPTYVYVTLNGSSYQVQTGNVTTTIDGTAYTYQAEGSYPNGTVPFNNPTATPQAANVLKVTQVKDRQGNVTTYNYNQGAWVTFSKIDGTTQEHPLSSVQMPNGHLITFTWGNGTNAPTNRIVAISDGTRTVSYGYTTLGGQSMLTSVTTAAGRTTQYGYGSAEVASGWNGSVATNLLTSIINPQGLTTQMAYQMLNQNVCPYMVTQAAPVCQRVIQPNGARFYFSDGLYYSDGLPDGDWPSGQGGVLETQYWEEWMGSASNGGVRLSIGGYQGQNSSGVFTVREADFAGGSTNLWLEVAGSGTLSTYDPTSENLLDQYTYEYPYAMHAMGDLSSARKLQTSSLTADTVQWVDQSTTYNFSGNPLSKTSTEYYYNNGNVQTRQATLSYAYWDATKYFQQKATKDQAGRYTYTDYYPSTASAGSRGQQYQVYDPAHAGFYLNTNITPPSYASSADYWKYQLTPTSGQYSAQFAYDGVGRCTDVYKLQSTTTTPWAYVHTVTSYGSNGSPTWGQASQVVEDSGGINRTTNTLAYTSWGKACQVQNAAGHQFTTSFDLDGNVQSVTRTDSNLNQTIASYTYGTSGITNGQPTSITDGLSGVSDSIAYQASGSGVGQVASTTETNGASSYTVSYAYNSTGDRWKTTYSTSNGTKTWEYDDYETVGETSKAKRVFQTLTLLQSGQPSAEQMQYAYGSHGSLRAAVFAQSPASGFTPSSGNPWYDSNHLASVRARAWYAYDPGGRVVSLQHYWDTWNSGNSSYSSEAVLDNECAYEYSGVNRGLKTSSSFYKNTSPGSPNWTLDHTETYSYDPNLDYLTGANYGDGLPNATPTWSYDAAANRTDTVADNLNRPVTIGGVASTSDILGNRLTLGTQTYGWDCLNRMTSYGTNNSYVYRADGMRVSKQVGSTATKYFYDGQMGMEDQDGTSTVTDYGLGARGVDYISKSASGTTTVGFPIFDAHGNMTACLFRLGSTYSLGNQRSFDAWGQVRQGSATGDPKGRYCANLGHKQDDESGLVYVRARYLEPTTGRFLSQDVHRSGTNYFVYSLDNPVAGVDFDGNDPSLINYVGFGLYLIGTTLALLASICAACATTPAGIMEAARMALTAIALIAAGASFASLDTHGGSSILAVASIAMGIFMSGPWVSIIIQNVAQEVTGGAMLGKTMAGPAIVGLLSYDLTCWAYIASIDYD